MTTNRAVQLIACSMPIRFQSMVVSSWRESVRCCYRHRGRWFCAARLFGPITALNYEF